MCSQVAGLQCGDGICVDFMEVDGNGVSEKLEAPCFHP
jgi:hypothetical protein